MIVTDVFSWLHAREISIEELEQIFIGYLNGTYDGEYKVLLEIEFNFMAGGFSGNHAGFAVAGSYSRKR